MSDHTENIRKRYLDKMSDPAQQEKTRKMVAFRRGFPAMTEKNPFFDVFGNKIKLVDGPGSRRITISNGDTTVKLFYGDGEYKDYIKIGDVILHSAGARTYVSEDGKTSIYVGETIEIKDN